MMTFTLFYAILNFYVMLVTECKRCLIDERIGLREGNVYFCNNSKLPTCCEKDYKATCCEDAVDKTLMEQLILWGLVAIIIAGFCIVYYCFARDREVFESATVKIAFGRLVEKFRYRHRQTQDFSDMQSKTEIRSNDPDVAPPFPLQNDDDDKLRLHNDDLNLSESRCGSSTCHDFSDDELELEEAEEEAECPVPPGHSSASSRPGTVPPRHSSASSRPGSVPPRHSSASSRPGSRSALA